MTDKDNGHHPKPAAAQPTVPSYSHVPYAPPVDGLGRETKAPLAKVFYTSAAAAKVSDGYAVHLDGRPIKTPNKTALVVPTRALAEDIAAEWQAQTTVIDPTTMPLTRLANTTLDAVIANLAAVRGDIVDFSGSDALCYRAEGPAALVERQAAHWDPLLAWSAHHLGAQLHVLNGISHAKQPQAAMAAVERSVAGFTAWQIAPLHVMTTITGSAIIALALAHRAIDLPTAWTAAHIDEDWQIATWGQDAEAVLRRQQRFVDMTAAYRMLATVS